MNKTYRLIWNEYTNTWVAVAEIAKARGKRASGAVLLAAAGMVLPVAAPLAAPPNPPSATQLPTGGQVVAGRAGISQNAATLNVTQTSNRAAIDWQTFNIGSQAQVNFFQPSSSAAILNRVLDSNPSQIFGSITSNGQVFLTNSSGIYFGRSASVNVGALTATTHSIGNDDFMAGNLRFTRDGATGSVANEGNLTASAVGSLGGYIALLAPEVRNNGVIVAQLGTVALAAGEAYELQFDGARLANIRVEPATIAALVENGNAVHAPGGLIILSAQAANRLQGGVINNSGTLEATGLVDNGGIIRLEASDRISHTGSINVDAAANSSGAGGHVSAIADLANHGSVAQINGNFSARGGNLGGDGGFVETSGGRVKIGSATHVDTRAPKGKTGTWLLDPVDFTIGTDITGADLSAALELGSVTIETTTGSDTQFHKYGTTGTEGNITVNEAVSWNANSLLYLVADKNITLNQPITATTTDPLGGFAVWYAKTDASGKLTFNAPANLQPGVQLQIRDNVGATTYTILNDLADLSAAIDNNQNGNYALGRDLDMTGAVNVASLGTSVKPFTGQFEGLGHTVSNLTINSSQWNVGLFGAIDGGALIRDITLDSSAITGEAKVGGLVGATYGNTVAQIVNSHVTNSTITATYSGDANVGGLIGYMWGGNISNSSASNVTVSTSGGHIAGGLAGTLQSVAVSGSSATGTVDTSLQGNFVGGLVGQQFQGSINGSYAQVNVSGRDFVGGMVGTSDSYNITNSFYNIDAVNIQGRTMNAAAHMVTPFGLYGSQYTDWMNGNRAALDAVTYFGAALDGMGNSDPTGYYHVDSVQKLKDMLAFTSDTSNNKFMLTTGLDISTMTNGYGWYLPIFRAAELVANGNSISNLTINQPFNDNIGLVGSLGANSSLTSLTLVAPQVTGRSNVGAAVGYGYGGSVNNVQVTGAATVTGVVSPGHADSGSNVGGLVGYTLGDIGMSSTSATVSVTPDAGSYGYGSNVGGLVGYTQGNIYYSAATGDVSGGSNVGGLVGQFYGYGNAKSITNSSASGHVSTTQTQDGNNIGGLVGYAFTYGSSLTISDSHATGAVTGDLNGSSNVGGLIGQAYAIGTFDSGTSAPMPATINITNSYHTTGAVEGYDNVGGLVGKAYAYGYGNGAGAAAIHIGVANGGYSYATGDVTGAMNVGGLVGQAYAYGNGGNATINISDSSSDSNVLTTSSSANGGGLVGYAYAKSNGSYGYGAAEVNVSTSSASSVSGSVSGSGTLGGLIGAARAYGGSGVDAATISVTDSKTFGDVTGDTNPVGGLIGEVNANASSSVASVLISGSYAMGNITGATGTGGQKVGGLVGRIFGEGSYGANITVTNSNHNTGTVSGDYRVGGLVGDASFAYGSNAAIEISNSFASGTVTGVNGSTGGLVGNADGSGVVISNSYASGVVNGTSEVGGLVGYLNNGATITSSHSTATVNGSANSVGGLVGLNNLGVVEYSYVESATITNTGGDRTGGLIGENLNLDGSGSFGRVTGNNVQGTVAVNGSSYVGGLIGKDDHGYIDSNTVGDGTHPISVGSSIENYVGGLVGYGHYSKISNE